MSGKCNNILYQVLICILLAILYSPLSQAATCPPPSLRTNLDDLDTITSEDDGHNRHYHNHNHIHVQLALDDTLTKAGNLPTIDVDPIVVTGQGGTQCNVQSRTNDNTNNRERVVISKLTSRKDQGGNIEDDEAPGQEKVIKYQVGDTGRSNDKNLRKLDDYDYTYDDKDKKYNVLDDNNDAYADENEEGRLGNRGQNNDYNDDGGDDEGKGIKNQNDGDNGRDDGVDVVIGMYDNAVQAKNRDRIRNNKLSHKYEKSEILSKNGIHEEDTDNNDHTLIPSTLEDRLAKQKKTRGGSNLDVREQDIDDKTHQHQNTEDANQRLYESERYGNGRSKTTIKNRNRKYGNNDNYPDEERDYDIQDPLTFKGIKGKKQGDTVYDDYDYAIIDRENTGTGKTKNSGVQNRNRNRIWKGTSRTTLVEEDQVDEGADGIYSNKPNYKPLGTAGHRGIRFRGEEIVQDVNDGLTDDGAHVRDEHAGNNPEGEGRLGNVDYLEAPRGVPQDDINEDEYKDDALGEGGAKNAYPIDDYPNDNTDPSKDHLPHIDTLDGYRGPGGDNRPPKRVQLPDGERQIYDYYAQNDQDDNLHQKLYSNVNGEGFGHNVLDEGQVGVTHKRPLRPRIQVDQYFEAAKPAAPINKPKVTMWPCITVRNRVVPFYQPIPCQIPTPKCSRVIIS